MTTMPLEARRQITAIANAQYEAILDRCFEIAMATIHETDIVMTEEMLDDEETVEQILHDYAQEIANHILSRMKLQGMLAARR